MKVRRPTVLLTAGLALALLVTAFVAFQIGSSRTPAAVPTARPSPTPSPEAMTVGEVFEALAPSVVSIRTPGGSGTGVIVNAEGIILTAFHVVEGALSIELAFGDGTKSAAEIIAADPAMDIAALAAETLPSVVVPAVLGGGPSIGDDVVAIGNQLGLVGSTTSGVISGLDRSAAREGAPDLLGLIQFDAAVNPGSSGGPLVNTDGEVIGIVVALANPTEADTFIGIGFAVPIGAAVVGGGGPQPQR